MLRFPCRAVTSLSQIHLRRPLSVMLERESVQPLEQHFGFSERPVGSGSSTTSGTSRELLREDGTFIQLPPLKPEAAPPPEEPPTEKQTKNMTPAEVVRELNKHIVGQDEAKKTIALALRNRWRRKQLQRDLRNEIIPKNILMVGPTGVGKTEIARRMAKILDAPFIKVEATKYTEVGFRGKDVDTMIQDLANVAVQQVKQTRKREFKKAVETATENRILDHLLGPESKETQDIRNTFRQYLRQGDLDDLTITILAAPAEPVDPYAKLLRLDEKTKQLEPRKVKVAQAKTILTEQESEKLVKDKDLAKEAIHLAQEDGIVFIDEIDKIASPRFEHKGPDASDEGVQRDLLPIIEGSVVQTKYGEIDTSYILFIASGAFHRVKPSDLLPELQGRLPIRVQMKGLDLAAMKRILVEPEHSLIKQQQALLKTEGVDLIFTDDAIDAIATIATEMNQRIENLGARRLHTVLEKVVEDVSYSACDLSNATTHTIDKAAVHRKMDPFLKSVDLQKHIL